MFRVVYLGDSISKHNSPYERQLLDARFKTKQEVLSFILNFSVFTNLRFIQEFTNDGTVIWSWSKDKLDEICKSFYESKEM